MKFLISRSFARRAALTSALLGILGGAAMVPSCARAQQAAPPEQVVPAAPTAAQEGTDFKPLPVPISPWDAKLLYSGRFDRSQGAGPRCDWPASAVSIRFRGTDLNVMLKGSGQSRWQVEVDGEARQKIVSPKEARLFTVAQGLPEGEHTVRLVKATEAFVGTEQVLGFELSEGGEALPQSVGRHRIEVIGDSISAGYGNEAAAKEEHFTPATENAYFTYGAIAARELGADYTCVAWSGKKMWPDNTLPELYGRALAQDEKSTWDFSKLVPDVVVINLATNDFGRGIPDRAGWTGAYKAFVARVRQNYPEALIYCAVGTMMSDWGEGKPLTTLRGYMDQVLQELKAGGETKVRLIDFGTQDAANGIGADWHPSVKTHQLMADQLAKAIRDDLKWE